MDDVAKLSDYSFNIMAVEESEKIRYTWALFHIANFMDMF